LGFSASTVKPSPHTDEAEAVAFICDALEEAATALRNRLIVQSELLDSPEGAAPSLSLEAAGMQNGISCVLFHIPDWACE